MLATYINITNGIKKRSKKYIENIKKNDGDASIGFIIGIVIAVVFAGIILYVGKPSVTKLWDNVMNKITTTLNS